MIEVRAIEDKDLEKIMNWRMRPDITKWMNTDPQLTMESQRKWLEKINSDNDSKHWMIVIDGVDSGVINITDIDGKSAFWGYYIGEKDKRSIQNAVSLELSLYKYCFEVLKLECVKSEVFAANKGVVQLHKKCGNVVDEIRVAEVNKNGVEYDVVILHIEKNKFEEISQNTSYEYINFVTE